MLARHVSIEFPDTHTIHVAFGTFQVHFGALLFSIHLLLIFYFALVSINNSRVHVVVNVLIIFVIIIVAFIGLLQVILFQVGVQEMKPVKRLATSLPRTEHEIDVVVLF